MSGLWSEGEIASSGIGSERAQVGSVAKRKPPASPGTGRQARICCRIIETEYRGGPEAV